MQVSRIAQASSHGLFFYPPLEAQEGLAQRSNLNEVWRKDGAGVSNFPQVFTPAPALLQEVPVRPALLQVSEDVYLSYSRALLLCAAGFDVTTSFSALVDIDASASTIAAVLFCQTVSPETAFFLARSLQEKCSTIVTMRVTNAPALELGSYQQTFVAPIPPEVLTGETMKLCTSIKNGTAIGDTR